MSMDALQLRAWRAARCRRWNRGAAHQRTAGQSRAQAFTPDHQTRAGHASWDASSARWRAMQGLCPLSAHAARRYVRPADIRAASGLAIPPGLAVVIWSAWGSGVVAGVDAWLARIGGPAINTASPSGSRMGDERAS